MRVLGENNSCRQHYLYNYKCFSFENPDSENKVHGKVACSDYIGSMKKAIELNLLLRRNKCSVISPTNEMNEYEICS